MSWQPWDLIQTPGVMPMGRAMPGSPPDLGSRSPEAHPQPVSQLWLSCLFFSKTVARMEKMGKGKGLRDRVALTSSVHGFNG